MTDYVCPLCGNSNPRYLGIRNGKTYCRRCLRFRGEEASGDYSISSEGKIFLTYSLSKEQKILSDRLIDNYRYGCNTLVHAVCGSGKTEIVLGVIRYALRNGQRVGFTVPRRDVVIELAERFRSIFQENKIEVVYGGHNEKIEADLICLTTHQLFRYQNYFDLLIIDEIDAFPYANNEVLEAFFVRAVKGRYVMLSATPSVRILKLFENKESRVLKLNKRFHGHPLPVPEIKICKGIIKYIVLLKEVKRFVKENKPVFIFAPTIKECESLYDFLKIFVKNGNYVHSKRKDRTEIIESFRKEHIVYLVTTAVLERGVTMKNLQVIVFNADHEVYDSHALTQIAGRVGRKKEAPNGRVFFICEEKTTEMEKSINEIVQANESV